MSVERKAIYAGSFDPPTRGHLAVIERASKMFDEVYVVIANNPLKKSYFDLKTREQMTRSMLGKGFYESPVCSNVKLLVVENQYIADVARRRGVQTLIRGLRNSIDYSYEQELENANRCVAEDLETIYLMCDGPSSFVSSSAVRSMIGLVNWPERIGVYLTPTVTKDIKRWYLRSRLQKLDNLPNNNHLAHYEEAWEAIRDQYRDRPYHNFDHLLNCFAWLDRIGNRYGTKDLIEWAIWFHDIADTIDESLDFLYDHRLPTIEGSLGDIKNLIRATDHASGPTTTRDRGLNRSGKLISSIDLAVLGLPNEDYRGYVEKVRIEYGQKGITGKDWTYGRYKFLDSMLAREYIYLDEDIRKELESQARFNMERERTMYSISEVD